ncbi:MAG: TMEM175 family protein [Actinomycetota bacterium]|nr:TMEM175 family protein [Actinomycetota bacterium]
MSEKGRVEAFSDGVFAIAITLLVLEIHVPEVEDGASLWTALGHGWPSYFAYVVGFMVIGVMWINHHTVFGYIARVNRLLLSLNLLLLLVIVAVPWAIAIVARYLDHGSQASVAVAVFGLLMTAHSITFTAFFQYITRSPQLLAANVDPAVFKGGRLSFAVGLGGYPILTLLAFVSAPLALALHGVLALYYAFDQTAARRAKALAERA